MIGGASHGGRVARAPRGQIDRQLASVRRVVGVGALGFGTNSGTRRAARARARARAERAQRADRAQPCSSRAAAGRQQ